MQTGILQYSFFQLNYDIVFTPSPLYTVYAIIMFSTSCLYFQCHFSENHKPISIVSGLFKPRSQLRASEGQSLALTGRTTCNVMFVSQESLLCYHEGQTQWENGYQGVKSHFDTQHLLKIYLVQFWDQIVPGGSDPALSGDFRQWRHRCKVRFCLLLVDGCQHFLSLEGFPLLLHFSFWNS